MLYFNFLIKIVFICSIIINIFLFLMIWGFSFILLEKFWDKLSGEGDCRVFRYLWYFVLLLCVFILIVGRFFVFNKDKEVRFEVEIVKIKR